MIDITDEKEAVFVIRVEDIQAEALRVLGRKLNDDEVLRAEKLLSYGIGESLGIVYDTILKELL